MTTLPAIEFHAQVVRGDTLLGHRFIYRYTAGDEAVVCRAIVEAERAGDMDALTASMLLLKVSQH